MVFTYLITIRKSQVLQYVSYNDLKVRVAGLCLRLPDLNIIMQGYECHGLYRQLHVHLIALSPRRINYRLLNKSMRGDQFIYHFKKCTIGCKEDMQRCIDYVSKYDMNKYEREQIMVENEAHYSNLFNMSARTLI